MLCCSKLRTNCAVAAAGNWVERARALHQRECRGPSTSVKGCLTRQIQQSLSVLTATGLWSYLLLQ